jgi:hypothetical protein
MNGKGMKKESVVDRRAPLVMKANVNFGATKSARGLAQSKTLREAMG